MYETSASAHVVRSFSTDRGVCPSRRGEGHRSSLPHRHQTHRHGPVVIVRHQSLQTCKGRHFLKRIFQ